MRKRLIIGNNVEHFLTDDIDDIEVSGDGSRCRDMSLKPVWKHKSSVL